MYSHYGSYNQNTGGATVSTHQPGMTWNGQQWTASTNVGASGSFSTYNNSYSTNTYPNPTTASTTTTTPSSTHGGSSTTVPDNPVQTYTQYYHAWTKQAQDQEKYGQGLPAASQQRVEVQRLADWAKYYADQSSRAAHYFYNNPDATSVPFDLPPVPTASLSETEGTASLSATSPGTATVSSTAASTDAAPVKATAEPMGGQEPFQQSKRLNNGTSDSRPEAISTTPTAQRDAASEQPPDGLKRYVHRCLSQCSSDEQVKFVQKQIELVIASALQDGNLHSTDWDRRTLIELPDRRPSAQSQDERATRRHEQDVSNKVGYYGSSSAQNSEVGKSNHGRYYRSSSIHEGAGRNDNGKSSQDNYYRPSLTQGESNNSNHDNYYRPSVQDNSKSGHDSYYGDNRMSQSGNSNHDSYYRSSTVQDASNRTSDNVNTKDRFPPSFSQRANPTSEPHSFRRQQLVENNSYYGHSSNAPEKSHYGNSSPNSNSNEEGRNYYGNDNQPHSMESVATHGSQSPSFRNQQLMENESYYGNPKASKRKGDKLESNSFAKRKTNDFKHHSPVSHGHQKHGRDQKLLENDSYYGNSASSDVSDEFGQNFNKKTKSTNHTSKNFSSRDQQFDKYSKSPKSGNKKKQETVKELDFIGLPGLKKGGASTPKRSDGLDRSSKALAKRANRFKGSGGASKGQARNSSSDNGFDKYMGKGTIGGSPKLLDDSDYEKMTVKGTCQTLEKKYLRLTAPPRAELVRPRPILEKHLQNLKVEWKSSEKRDYNWFCSQFKAVRQDCTVQRIRNAFTVDVYETHARIALEEGDLNEYNQCQTQLKDLHTSLDDPDATKNRNEFIAYRLIYYVFLTGNKKYDGGSSDLFKIMLSLSPEQREDPAIKHALQVRSAVTEGDYHCFFLLLRNCPNLSALLMEYMVSNMRFLALQRMAKAYRPTAEVDFVLKELGISDLEEGKKWLISCGCVLNESGTAWKTKESNVRESDLTKKTSSLI